MIDTVTDQVLSRCTRNIDTSGPNQDSGAREQMRTCFPATKGCEIVRDAWVSDNNTSTDTHAITASSMPWFGYATTVYADKVPTSQKDDVETESANQLNHCQSYWGSVKQTGKIVGIVLGVLGGVACLCFGGWVCQETIQEKCFDSNSRQRSSWD